MNPDATYKHILSHAVMVEELMRWLVADVEMHGDRPVVTPAWNFSASSRCHCSARCGGQSTAVRRISPQSIGEAALRQTLDPAKGIDEREVRLGHRSAGIEDAPQNGRGEREVESDHPLNQAQVRLGGEVFGQLLTQRCRHGLGLVIRETCVFELSREAKGVDRGSGHVSNPSTD